MSVRYALIAAAGAVTVLSSPAFAVTETFDSITLSPTQAPGAWYVDRYAPKAFEVVDFEGDNRLLQHIDITDGATSRPGPYSSSFYNTQGRKLDLEPSTTSVSIDLYVNAKWEVTGTRMAGLWGTGVDALGNVSAYPVIQFSSDGTEGFFQIYDSNTGAYTSLGLPDGFSYNAFTTLNYSLVGDSIFYSIGDLSGSYDANGTVAFSNVILQGYNTTNGDTFDIYWDNLSTAAVPEPTTWALMIAGFAAVGVSLRRRKTNIAFA